MHTGKTLFQSIFWRGLYYVSTFIINILIARHFEASLSGSVYYLSSIYAFVLLVSSLSLESGIIYFAAKKEIPVNRLFNFSIAWSLATGFFTYLAVQFYFKEVYGQISQTLLIFSAVLYISGNMLITFCSGFFYARNNFIVPNLIIIAGTLILIVLIPFGGRSLIQAVNDDNYFYFYFGSFFLQGIAMATAAKIKYIKSVVIQFLSYTEFRILFRYCARAFLGNIIFFLLYRVDYFFVEKYCSAGELGNYIQVSKLVHLFFILPTILASVVFPLTAGGQISGFVKFLPLLSRTIFFLYAFICLVFALTGKWLFPFVFGTSFSIMYQPFLMLIPGILALSGIFTLTAYFSGKNKIKINIIAAVYALIVILAGDIVLIPEYGIVAAALVSSLGYIVYQVYVIHVFKREYPCSVADFFIFKWSDLLQIKNNISTSLKIKNEI
jgi:O-antigen/teichoic acid export membrane protein